MPTWNACFAVRVNETDTFADEEGLNDEYFDFEDISGMTSCSTSCHGCYLLLFSDAVSFCRDLVDTTGAHLWILKQQAMLFVLCPKKHLKYACMYTFSSFVLHDLKLSYCGVLV